MRAQHRPGVAPSARAAARLAAAVAAIAAGCGGTPPDGPNLLLVTVDTLRPDRLECYGGPPGVGRVACGLAERGARYLWAFSPAPSTAPAIASLLTSRYPSYHGVSQFATTSLPESALTVAEVLADAGWHTAAFVSNPVLSPARNLTQGFDVYDAHLTRAERNREGFAEREAEGTTDAARAWIHVVEEPWFLWVHFQDPHGPYEPPGAPPALDGPGAASLPALADHSGHRGIPAYQVLGGARGIPTYEERYLSEIRYLDAQLERLFEAARAGGRPTGILLTSDHGEAFGEDDYWFAHGHSVGLDQIRVPLLWHPPGSGDGATPRAPVSTLDVAPTLLAAAGLPVPASFQGAPLPREPGAPPEPRPLFSEHRLRVAVVAGGLYHARDRRVLDAPVPDRITGGWLHPLAPRTTRLEGAAGPEGEAGADAAALEPALGALLDRFLVDAGQRPETPAGELPESTRSALEALGYLE